MKKGSGVFSGFKTVEKMRPEKAPDPFFNGALDLYEKAAEFGKVIAWTLADVVVHAVNNDVAAAPESLLSRRNSCLP